jgi:hypothetical protein
LARSNTSPSGTAPSANNQRFRSGSTWNGTKVRTPSICATKT